MLVPSFAPRMRVGIKPYVKSPISARVTLQASFGNLQQVGGKEWIGPPYQLSAGLPFFPVLASLLALAVSYRAWVPQEGLGNSRKDPRCSGMTSIGKPGPHNLESCRVQVILELLIYLPLPPECWNACLCSARDGTQDCMHARQAFYQPALSSVPFWS